MCVHACVCVCVKKQRRGEGEETERDSKATREREREKTYMTIPHYLKKSNVHVSALNFLKCTNMRNETSCF